MLRPLLHSTVTQLRTRSTLTKFVQKKKSTELQLEVVTGQGPLDPRVSQFYHHNWLREEPLGLSDSSGVLQTQTTALLTTMEGGEVVAACSAGPLTYSSVDDLKRYADTGVGDPRTQRLLNLFAAVVSDAGLLTRLRVPSLWHVPLLTTTPRMRRLGLARFLISQQRRLATKLGYSALSVYCLDDFLARSLEKVGYLSLPARPVNSFKDLEGKPWLSERANSSCEIRVMYHLVQVNKDHDSWLM